MNQERQSPRRPLQTWGKGRAVRLKGFDYSHNVPIHLTICAESEVLSIDSLPGMICESIEFCCGKMDYNLFCYCLMPDHLHVLLSPADSGQPIERWLQRFKSFTTHECARMRNQPRLWQLSANDHVCRKNEVVENVVRYIVNNPVRAGLVQKWDDWRWTKVFVEI